MQHTDPVVGAFEAKTRLAELLRETERGATFVIERRGKKVARLVPYEASPDADRPDDLAALFAAFREVRSRVRGGAVDVRELVEEGRR
jgi:prevent-host-death family protein